MDKKVRLLLIVVVVAAVGGGALVARFHAERAPAPEGPVEQEVTQERTPPNLVLITLDTTRADHLGAYGYKEVKTPTIDTLAKEGVLFRRAVSVAPITLPSHSSIMTGLYPPSHGVRDNGTFSLPAEITTLAEILQKDGYATGAFVGAAVLEQRYGLTQGFDVYDADFSQGRRRPQFMYAERRCEQVVEAALQWLEQKEEGKRFFTWLHFYDPHASYAPPEPWATQYERSPYDGEIAYADSCIGKFTDALRQGGLWRDTLLVLTADHGESLGEHGEKTHGLFIYDATVQVPLIFHCPTLLPAGRAVGKLVSSVDIFPTILAVLGKEQEGPQSLDGSSLLPLMRGGRERTPRIAYSETLLPKYHYGWAELKGVTTQTWKLIEAPRPELYSLAQDPKELVNVYETSPHLTRQLTKTITNIGGRDGASESRLALDPETAERLRGLGYIWMPGPAETETANAPPDPKDMIHTHLYVQRGREFIRQDRFDEAIGEFRKVIAANPRSLSTYFDLASAYLGKGEPEQAREPMTGALKLDPQNPRVYSMMGVVENRLGNKDEAIKLFQRALELDPRFEEAYVNMAALWQQAGDLDKAEEAVRTVLKSTPTHAGAHSRLGSLLLVKGKLSEAEAELRAALKTDPYHAQAYTSLGVLYDQQGRYDEALNAYQEALKSEGRLAEVHHAIGAIYTKQGKLEQAEVQLKEALRINPQLFDGFISLGIVYDQQGLEKKAIEANEQALQLNPQAYQAYGNLAVVSIKKREYAKAEELLHKALAIKPEYPEGYNNLAVLYLEQGDLKKAIAAAEQALRYKPDYPEALTNLGILYDKQGQPERSVEYHQRALAANPAYWEAHNNLALTFLRLRRYDEAEKELIAVLRAQPNFPAVHKRLGDLYFEHLKQWQKAREHYRIYLRLASAGKDKREVETRLQKIGRS
jgi:tetratricopeptide (TPR) repeat protein